MSLVDPGTHSLQPLLKLAAGRLGGCPGKKRASLPDSPVSKVEKRSCCPRMAAHQPARRRDPPGRHACLGVLGCSWVPEAGLPHHTYLQFLLGKLSSWVVETKNLIKLLCVFRVREGSCFSTAGETWSMPFIWEVLSISIISDDIPAAISGCLTWYFFPEAFAKFPNLPLLHIVRTGNSFRVVAGRAWHANSTYYRNILYRVGCQIKLRFLCLHSNGNLLNLGKNFFLF